MLALRSLEISESGERERQGEEPHDDLGIALEDAVGERRAWTIASSDVGMDRVGLRRSSDLVEPIAVRECNPRDCGQTGSGRSLRRGSREAQGVPSSLSTRSRASRSIVEPQTRASPRRSDSERGRERAARWPARRDPRAGVDIRQVHVLSEPSRRRKKEVRPTRRCS
jgi:hypothetical protein